MCCCPYALPVGASLAAAAHSGAWHTPDAAAAAIPVVAEDGDSYAESDPDADKENEDPEYDETDGEHDGELDDSIIRGKSMYDGCDSIDDMIECLQQEAEYLRSLKEQGWRLRSRVVDDYAFVHNPSLVQRTRVQMRQGTA